MSVEQALKRPADYNGLSLEAQWAIDKRLGILDWDPTPEEVARYRKARAPAVEEEEVEDDDSIGDGGEGRMMAGMTGGNRGLAEYGGFEPGGTGCYGCGGRGCDSCTWGDE